MASLPPLFIELKANVSEFTSKMGDARGEVEKLQRTGSGHFSQLATVGKAAFLGLGAAAVAFGASAVKVGIDQEEANARLTTALHNTGSAMTALSAPVEEAESRMRRLGFTNGDTTDSLAKLTNATHDPTRALNDLGLAANIARARHIDLSSATDLLAKVETGHVALLGRLGINTKDATGATISQTEAIKRLSDMYGGQASAYSQTFAGRTATLKAEVENLQERIGMFLIPKIEALVHVGASAIEWADRNKTAAEGLAVVVGGPLVVAMGAYLLTQAKSVALTAVQMASKLPQMFLALGAAIRGTTAAEVVLNETTAVTNATMLMGAGVVAGFAAVLAGAIAIQRQAQQQGGDWATKWTHGIPEGTDKIKAINAEIDKLKGQKVPWFEAGFDTKIAHTNEQIDGQIAGLRSQRSALLASADAGKGLATAQDVAKQAIEDTKATVADLTTKTGLSTERVDELAKKLGIDLSKATADAADKIAALNDRLKFTDPTALDLSVALQTLSDRTADAKEKANAFKSALDDLIGTNISAERAAVDLAGVIDGLGAKIRANKDSLDMNTKAGRDNITMIEDAVEKTRTHIAAMRDHGASADQLRAAFAGDTQALRDQLTQAGFTKAKVDELIASYGLVPGTIDTIISADTGLAQQALDQLIAKISQARNAAKDWFTAGTSAGVQWFPGMTTQARASGGPIGPGDYVVGEEGPEFMHIGPDGRGYVRNASATKRMYAGAGARAVGGSGGATVINYNINVEVPGLIGQTDDIMRAIHRGMLDLQNRQPLGFRS